MTVALTAMVSILTLIKKSSFFIMIIFLGTFFVIFPKASMTTPAPSGNIIFQVTENLGNETIVFKIHSSFSTELETISSENFIKNTLNGKMFQGTFENLVTTLQQFGIDQMTSDANGNVTIFLNYGSINANVTYNSANTAFQQIHAVVSGIIDRYSGKAWDYPSAWPLDVSITILESFPEQYSVQAIIQRGPDPLTYVMTVPVVITVFLKGDPTNVLHQSTTSTEIASGGKSTTITFPTFSVDESYRLEDLKFKITVNSRASLTYDLSNGQIDVSTNSTDLTPTSATTAIDSTVLLLLTVATIAIHLSKRYKKSKD